MSGRVLLALAVGLLGGALLGVYVGRMPVLGPPRADEGVLVDARLPLRSEGLVVPFTVPADASVRIDLDLPAMLESDVQVGPLYLALRPGVVLEPEPREDRTHHVIGCETPPFVQTFAKPGAYAVRVPPIPTAMGMESEMFVTVRITRVDG